MLENKKFPLPSHFDYEKDIAFINGTVIHVRPINGEDESSLRNFFEMLSEESVYFRFGSHRINLDHDNMARFCLVDYYREFAFLAVVPGKKEVIIGDARLHRLSSLGSAELSLVIADQWQGLGVGSLLMNFCLVVAERIRLTTVLMEVMKSNVKMKRLGLKYGFQSLPSNRESGMEELELKIGLQKNFSLPLDEKYFPTNTLTDSWGAGFQREYKREQ